MAGPVGRTEAEPGQHRGSAFAKIGVLVIAGFVSASLTLILLVVGSAYSASRAGNASLQVEQAERLAATLDRIVINILRAEIAQLLIQSRDAAGSGDGARFGSRIVADAHGGFGPDRRPSHPLATAARGRVSDRAHSTGLLPDGGIGSHPDFCCTVQACMEQSFASKQAAPYRISRPTPVGGTRIGAHGRTLRGKR